MTELNYRFQVRRGTAAVLASVNEIPMQGELVWEDDQGLTTGKSKLKIGDGVTRYNSLPYVALGGGVEQVHAGAGCTVDNTDPKNPIINVTPISAVTSVQAGLGVAVDSTNPASPIISSTVAGVALKGRVATYAALPSSGNTAGDAYLVDADQLIYVWNGSAWPTNGNGMHSGGAGTPLVQLVPPKASIFTLFGTGATLTDKIGRLQFSAVSATAGIKGGVLNLPSPPYTVDFGGAAVAFPGSGVAVAPGICISDGTKYVTYYPVFTGSTTASGMTIERDNYTNATTFANTPITRPWAFNPAAYFLRVTDDGTTRNWYASQNGLDFNLFYSEATNTFLTATKCGIACYNNSNGTLPAKMSVYHWKVTNSVLGDAA